MSHSLTKGFWLIGLLALAPAFGVESPRDQPNIILINLDDADQDLFSQESLDERYPSIRQIAGQGIRFGNMHVTIPLCGPSRACLFRGQYASSLGIRVNNRNHVWGNGFGGGFGVYRDNGYVDDDLGVWMKQAGYRTMMVGKYLHEDFDYVVPPGWDDFYASLGDRYFGTYQFTNRDAEQGAVSQRGANDYRTNVESDDARRLIGEHRDRDDSRPFFLYLAPFGPHSSSAPEGMVEPKYANLWPDLRMPFSPDVNEDVSDKVSPFNTLPIFKETRIHRLFRDRVLATKSVDDMVGAILTTLESHGLIDNTYIFFTSDHGYLLGHHRVVAKKYPYHRATNVPMFVWGPGVNGGQQANHLLAHIDIAPTLLELAGAEIPQTIEGKSFLPLVFNANVYLERDWREAILIENWERKSESGKVLQTVYSSLRTYDEIYTEWATGKRDYFDLELDPLQLTNSYSSLVTEKRETLRSMLHEIRSEADPIVTITRPWQWDQVIGPFETFRGIAEDNSGVDQVRLVITDRRKLQFWNGISWQKDRTFVQASLANRGGIVTNWSYNFSGASTLDDENLVLLIARAYDKDNNQVAEAQRFSVDRVSPETSITIPVAGDILASSIEIEGTAADENGINEIRLTIKDITNQLHWNGTQWQAAHVQVVINPQGNNWSYSLQADPGRFGIWARAYDRFGNNDRSPASVVFHVN